MAKRDIPEINAGSMADIAFLLLIFWLVTTTMDRDMGLKLTLPKKLPPCKDCPKVRERNVLKIAVNGLDQLLIEDEEAEVEDVASWVERFYDPENTESNMPERYLVDETSIRDTLAALDLHIKALDQITDGRERAKKETKLNKAKKEWLKNEAAFNAMEKTAFYCLSKRAVIRYESNNGTTFEVYFQVLDQIKGVLRDRRNDFAMDKWGITYDEMMKLYEEMMAAYKNEGAAVKKKTDTHRMADANKAFAHFAWGKR